jgi:hypothetical protein
MTQRDSGAEPESPLEVDKLTLRELLRLGSRLTLASALALVGALGAAVGLGAALESWRSDAEVERRASEAEAAFLTREEAFGDAFVQRFVDEPGVMMPLARNIARLRPDGLERPYEIIASMLWQLRASRGSAEFLSGDKAHRMTVAFEPNSIKLGWDETSNLVPEILANVGAPATPEDLRKHNSNLNWAGYTRTDHGVTIVRGPDGGLSVTQ